MTEVENNFSEMRWFQAPSSPHTRSDGRVIRIFYSHQGAIRVSAEEPASTGNLISKEIFYSREEIEEFARNINTGGRLIQSLWMNAGEEYFKAEATKVQLVPPTPTRERITT